MNSIDQSSRLNQPSTIQLGNESDILHPLKFSKTSCSAYNHPDGVSPATIGLTSDMDNLTLDASPKESQFTKLLQSIDEDLLERFDYIDEQEEQKSKLQKYQSFKVPKEQIRRVNKNKTCEPYQQILPISPKKQQQQQQQEVIPEILSPNSHDTSHSNKDQTFKFIKELWDSSGNSPDQSSPSMAYQQLNQSQRQVPQPQVSESEYFNDLVQDPQQLRYEGTSNQGLNFYQNKRQGNQFYSHEPSPQLYYEPDIQMDLLITGLIEQLWGNQIVSRKLQKMLESGTDEQKELIVQKLERVSPQIQKDVFGNYVVQKVFECTKPKLQLRMFNKLKTHFYDLSKNTFGCRVMQKIIEYTMPNDELQKLVLGQLQQNIRSLIYDVNGNYVIYKMMEIYDKSKMEFLIPIIEETITFMGQQIYGCKIIHKAIQNYSQQQMYNLIKLSVKNYDVLCQTEYGNHVLQHILQHCAPSQEKTTLVQLVILQFYQLSVNKYASNTVERALEVLGKQELYGISQWLLCRNHNSYNSNFVVLANHPYANYVIKKYLVLSDYIILRTIGDHLAQNQIEFQSIRSTVHGQRISSLLEKQLQSRI